MRVRVGAGIGGRLSTGLVEEHGGGQHVPLQAQSAGPLLIPPLALVPLVAPPLAAPLLTPPPVLEGEQGDGDLGQLVGVRVRVRVRVRFRVRKPNPNPNPDLVVIEGELGEERQRRGERCGGRCGEVRRRCAELGGLGRGAVRAELGGEGGGEVGGGVGREGCGEVRGQIGEAVVGEVQRAQGGEAGPRGEGGDAVAAEVELREGAELGELGRDLLLLRGRGRVRVS